MGGKKKSTPGSVGGSGAKKAGKKEYKSNEKHPALGEISHVSLSSYQEDVLLELFKQLDSARTRVLNPALSPGGLSPWPHAGSQAGQDTDTSSSDGSSQSGDSESEQEGADGHADAHTDSSVAVDPMDTPRSAESLGALAQAHKEAAPDEKPIHSAERKLMIRQMIRDDRRRSLDGSGSKSASKQARKEYHDTGVLSPQYVSPGVTRRVRLSVVLGELGAKSYVVDRSEKGLLEVVTSCRRDFQIEAGLGSLVLSTDRLRCVEVSIDTLAQCADGSMLYLISRDAIPAKAQAETMSDVVDSGTDAPSKQHSDLPCWTPRCKDELVSESMRRELCALAAEQPMDTDSRRPANAILAGRRGLPIYCMKEEIIRTIRENQVVVVAGDTGSGKSTQLPQYLLDDAILSGRGSEAFIVCTQPRRLSAISLAERVAEEISAGTVLNPAGAESSDGEPSFPSDAKVYGYGGAVDGLAEPTKARRGSALCGYEVRLKSTLSRHTRVLYCTTGILLRKLLSPAFLENVSHIILDEVHERQVEMDFLCAMLKARLRDHPALKLVLMSATMDEGFIANYYSSAAGGCPVLHIPGRMYPVTLRYVDEIPRFFTRWGGVRPNGRTSSKGAGAFVDYAIGASASKRLATLGRESGGGGGDCSNLAETMDGEAAPSPACDAEKIVELMRCIINKHYTENTQDYFPAPMLPLADKHRTGEAILVFLSGLQDIRRIDMELRKAEYFSWLPSAVCGAGRPLASPEDDTDDSLRDERRRLVAQSPIQIHILHSTVSPEQQRRVFSRTMPGQWKIILSTNIAETSVTIDDVTHVIDTGLVKLVGYNPTSHISTLVEQPISMASARQRAGRAGRTRPGECWRLSGSAFWTPRVPCVPPPGADTGGGTDTDTDTAAAAAAAGGLQASVAQDTHAVAAEKTAAEILRMPLEDVILKTLQLRLGNPEAFLSTCLDSPDLQSIRLAVARLVDMGAIEPGLPLSLSPLGSLMASLPMDALLAKMLIYSTLLNCVDSALTVAAFLSGKSPFLMTLHKKDEYYKKFMQFCPKNCPYSDHIAVVNVYSQWSECLDREGSDAAFQFCRENFLSSSVLEDIAMLRELFLDNLAREGLVSAEGGGQSAFARSVGTADQFSLLNFCLSAGLYPNVVRVCRMPVKAAPGMRLSKAAQHKTKLHVLQADGREVSFHPSSLLHRQVQSILNDRKDAFVVFHKKLASASSIKENATIHLHDASAVPAVALVLFAPGAFLAANRKRIVIDSWLHVTATELHAVMLLRLNTLIKEYMKSRVQSPSADRSVEQAVITAALLSLVRPGPSGREEPVAKKLF